MTENKREQNRKYHTHTHTHTNPNKDEEKSGNKKANNICRKKAHVNIRTQQVHSSKIISVAAPAKLRVLARQMCTSGHDTHILGRNNNKKFCRSKSECMEHFIFVASNVK